MAKLDWTYWLTVFGLLIDHRIFLFLRASRSWAVISYQPQLPLMYFGLSVVLVTGNLESGAVNFVLQIIMIFGLLGFRFQQVKSQENSLRQSFHGWLENLLLLMKMGSSFRSAFRISLEKCTDIQLRTLLTRQEVGFQIQDQAAGKITHFRCSPPFFREVFRRLTEIEAIPHRAQVRVESLISAWRQELWFRRRSRQVLRQSRVQLGFLGLMYVVLTIWSAKRYPLSRLWPSLKVSLFFVCAGIAIVLLSQRRREWKI